MYQSAVAFEVPAERRRQFLDAALENARQSVANEPGTQRFEVTGS